MKINKKFKADLILICGLIFIGVIIFLVLVVSSDDGNYVQVRVNGKVTSVYPLSQNRTEIIQGISGKNTLVIENREAYISEADCPDGLCKNMGRISKNGQSLICLPNKVVVEVTDNSDADKKESDVDIIVK